MAKPCEDDGYASNGNNPLTKPYYDKNGNVIKVTDPRGIETVTAYDEWNRPTKVTANATASVGASDRLVTETRYDAAGNVRALVLDNGSYGKQITTYGYDAFDRRITETLPSVGDGITRQTVTTYSRAGDVLTVTDPMNQKVETDYDRAGRATTVNFKKANGTIEETRTNQYDAAGRLVAQTDRWGTTTYGYDDAGRQISEARTSNEDAEGEGIADSYEVISAYDASGNRTRVVHPDTGRVLINRYDRGGRLVQLDDYDNGTGTPHTTTFTYDLSGNLTGELSANGVQTSRGIDALGRVTSIYHQASNGTLLYYVGYKYDLAGNRRSADQEMNAGAGRRYLVNWSYDGLYRLSGESWSLTAAQSVAYTYDPAGNRLTEAVTKSGSTTTTTNTYDELNQLKTSTTSGVTTTYSYNKNGSMDQKTVGGATVSYSYDVAGRLWRAMDSSNNVLFLAYYDGRTRRIATVEPAYVSVGSTPGPNEVTLFRYDGGTSFQEARDLDGDGDAEVIADLVRAGGLGGGIGGLLYRNRGLSEMGPQQFPTEYYSYDALGNTVLITVYVSTLQQATIYDAFGEIVAQPTNATDNNRLRNTKERSQVLGLDNDGFRYYSPEAGRYVSRDPLGYADGLNVYVSVHNNPVNKVDPLGLRTEPEDMVARQELRSDRERDAYYQKLHDGNVMNQPGGYNPLPGTIWTEDLQSWGHYQTTRAESALMNRGWSNTAIATSFIGGVVLSGGAEFLTPENLASKLVPGGQAAKKTANLAEWTFKHIDEAATGAKVAQDGVRAVKNIAPEGISMEQAIERGIAHAGEDAKIILTKGGNIQLNGKATTDAAGNTTQHLTRFDVNPADRHVQKMGGPHLNLEIQVNSVKQKGVDPHTPIDPSTVRRGDHQ